MLPAEFIARMQRLLLEQYDAFAACYDAPRHTALRINRLKTDAPPDLTRFGLTPVPWAKDGYYYAPDTRPGLCAYHDAGLYYLQEPSAMAPVGLLNAQPGERVLDLCAAPGGKSTQLASEMAGRGLLVCNEINGKRAQILSSNIERMGIANALVLNEHPARLAERFAGFFDKILVDAPCSGEGMFRKEPIAAEEWTPDTPAMCAARQLEILHSAAQMLRPGGRLVYSTCTFSPEENEGTVSAFLRAHPDFSIETVPGTPFAPGRPDWIDDPVPGLEHTFRLWPHLLAGEGHYAAVLRRAGDAAPADVPYERGAKLQRDLLDFAKDAGAAIPEGTPVCFGPTVYLAPQALPQLAGLKVLRAGLRLGESKKGRFEPAHAWALWLKMAVRTADFAESAQETARYLAGEAIPGEQAGWTLVRVDGLSLGWVKGADGQLKNHYPKALRRRNG